MSEWKKFENHTSIELIKLIKMKQTNELDATLAFHVFCFRFQKEIIKKSEIICKNNDYDTQFAIEVVDRTFERFWKYPSFSKEKMKVKDVDVGIILYLSRIAQRSFTDLLCEKNGLNISPYTGEEQIIYDFPEHVDLSSIKSSDIAILQQVFKKLTWKHKVVYLTYAQHEINGKKLPRKLLASLRSELKLSQETIRFYRYEVIEKIQEYKELWQKREQILMK